MDILYSKVLKTDEKNEYISDIEYLAKVRVDNGDDESSYFDSDALRDAVITELKRRALLEISYILTHHLRKSSVKEVLKTHELATTSKQHIIDAISKKKYSFVKTLRNDLMTAVA